MGYCDFGYGAPRFRLRWRQRPGCGTQKLFQTLFQGYGGGRCRRRSSSRNSDRRARRRRRRRSKNGQGLDRRDKNGSTSSSGGTRIATVMAVLGPHSCCGRIEQQQQPQQQSRYPCHGSSRPFEFGSFSFRSVLFPLCSPHFPTYEIPSQAKPSQAKPSQANSIEPVPKEEGGREGTCSDERDNLTGSNTDAVG